MRKILLFAVLLLTLMLLPTVPVAAVGPPPTEETYYVAFTGPDITSDQHKLMRRRAHGGKQYDLINFPGENSTLTFEGDVWIFDSYNWMDTQHDGKLGIWIDLKTEKVGMSYQFDFTHEPLDFWVLESTYEGSGEWISEGASMQVHFGDDPFEIWRYSEQGVTYTRSLTFDVTIEPEPEKPEEGKAFSPNYAVTFAENVEGTGLVEVKGYFADISSNVAVNDVELTFSSIFGGYGGLHVGYLHMERTSKVDPTIEIFYTYGPENDLFYHFQGFGSFEGDKKAGWFTIDTTGYVFTLSESVGGEWIPVWTGKPLFTVTGEKI